MKRNRADGEDEDDHQVKKPHLTSDTIVVPSSLLTKVFEYLPSTTLAKCSRVSKEWKLIAEAENLWKDRCLNLFINTKHEPEVWWSKKKTTSRLVSSESNEAERQKRIQYHEALGYTWKQIYSKIAKHSCAVCHVPASWSPENNSYLCDDHNPENEHRLFFVNSLIKKCGTAPNVDRLPPDYTLHRRFNEAIQLLFQGKEFWWTKVKKKNLMDECLDFIEQCRTNYVKEKYNRHKLRAGKTEEEIKEEIPKIMGTQAVLDFLESGESNFMSSDLISRAEAELKEKDENEQETNPAQKNGWTIDSDEEWLVADGLLSSEEEWQH